jgi:hypothetical protein
MWTIFSDCADARKLKNACGLAKLFGMWTQTANDFNIFRHGPGSAQHALFIDWISYKGRIKPEYIERRSLAERVPKPQNDWINWICFTGKSAASSTAGIKAVVAALRCVAISVVPISTHAQPPWGRVKRSEFVCKKSHELVQECRNVTV